MAGYRALDIETVADSSVWTPPPPKWSLCPDGDFMRLPDGTMVAAAGVRFDEPFPQPHANRVVAICWCDMSDQDGRYYHLDGVGSLCRWTNVLDVQECDHAEREMLSIFGGVEENDHALLVTWNGRSFDLPVINMRSLKHRLAMPWYYQTEGMRYRYSESGHCDLMDVLGDYGAARHMKLHDVCRLIGLPGKFGDVHGSSVAEVVAEGVIPENMERVRRYCLADAVQTALLFVRTRFHKGMINAEEHDSAVGSFAESDIINDLLPELDWDRLRVAT